MWPLRGGALPPHATIVANEGFIDLAIQPFKKYVDFKGRARRKEYWYFMLLSMLIAFSLGVIGAILNTQVLSNIFSLAVLIPGVAVAVRRMHDTDRSGWWAIVPIVGIVFSCFEGQKRTNRFGADPKLVNIV